MRVLVAPRPGSARRSRTTCRSSAPSPATPASHAPNFERGRPADLGEPRIDYKASSYICVRYGRRVWAPLWPRKDGAYVYLPDPDGSRDQPSLAFSHFEAAPADEGPTAAGASKYNVGSNSIGLRLTRPDIEKPIVEELLRASHEALTEGAQPRSERQRRTAAPPDGDEHHPRVPSEG